MNVACLVALAAVVTTEGAARAEAPVRGRVDLRGGLGVRRDRLVMPGLQVEGSGGAPSSLGLGAAWFGSGAIGLSGQVEIERFSLAGAGTDGRPVDLRMTGAEAAAGLAGRWNRGPLQAEARLGYGLLQLPLVDAPDGAFASAPLFTHGPAAAARLALGFARGFALEAAGRVYPVGFGGQRAGAGVRVQRYAFSGDLAVGHFTIAGSALTGLFGYELGHSRGDGGPLSVRQTRHLLTVGLRASFAPAPAPLSAAPAPRPAPPPPAPPPPVEPPPPAPATTFVVGLVRDARGAPLAAEVRVPEAGVTVRANPRGRFRIPLPTGSYTLLIEAPGFILQRKTVRVRAGEQHIYNIDLQRRRQTYNPR
jgi:hypothetical protein